MSTTANICRERSELVDPDNPMTWVGRKVMIMERGGSKYATLNEFPAVGEWAVVVGAFLSSMRTTNTLLRLRTDRHPSAYNYQFSCYSHRLRLELHESDPQLLPAWLRD